MAAEKQKDGLRPQRDGGFNAPTVPPTTEQWHDLGTGDPDLGHGVVLNPPTVPSRARSKGWREKGDGGLLLRPGAESDRQKPALLFHWLRGSTQQLAVSMEAKKKFGAIENKAAANQEPAGAERRVQ